MAKNLNGLSECVQCTESLALHGWLYLLFMSISLLLFEWYIIDYSLKRRNLPLEVLTLHFSATIEVTSASLLALLFFSDPWGSFALKTCKVFRLSDWYTVFFNPTPDFKETLRCTQEVLVVCS